MSAFAAALLIAQAASAAAPPAPPLPPGCPGEQHAAFDFWVGEWGVYRAGTDTQVARSRIEKLYGGCAIRENWMPLQGTGGGSLNSLDPATGRWHQTWIGSAPGRTEFVGGPVGAKMILSGFSPYAGGPGRPGLVRMTFTPNPDGTVRQHGEASFDEGITWNDRYDFIYRPHDPSHQEPAE